MSKPVTPRYDVRRFTTASRPDAFEVYVVATGETASFPGRKRECVAEARRLEAAEAR